MLWLGGWWQPGDWLQDWRADYVAAPRQVAEWKLADGSYLSLTPAARCACVSTAASGGSNCCAAPPRCGVKRDTLPFVVEAGEGRARVLGTEFEVRRGAGETRVTVLQGRVAVSAGTGAGAAEKCWAPASRSASPTAGWAGPWPSTPPPRWPGARAG